MSSTSLRVPEELEPLPPEPPEPPEPPAEPGFLPLPIALLIALPAAAADCATPSAIPLKVVLTLLK